MWRLTSVLTAVLLLSPLHAGAAAPAALAPFVGTWSGTGAIKLDNGQSEAVKCKAYYTDRGAAVGLSLRCASAGSKIDLRAQLEAAGAKVSGNWEERQFNAAGSLSGAVTGNRLLLAMEGGGLKANVVLAAVGASQTMSITADNGGFKSVTVSFARD